MRETAARPASILSPTVDFLCAGGLALIVLVPLLAFGPEHLSFAKIGWALYVQALINSAHFMASYRIVYRDRESIRRHQWAAIWIPLILIVVAVVGVAVSTLSQPVLTTFFAVSSAYLAWHYTGQVWGMMASYTYISGDRFEKRERQLIRTSLRILLAWHIAWWLHVSMRRPQDIEAVYRFLGYAANLAVVLGIAGMLMFRKRTGHFPPARAMVAWIAIFFWYAAMAKWGVAGLFLVQFFHSIQYLEFPARIELNRAAATSAGRVVRQMAIYATGLVAASVMVLLLVPSPAMSVVTRLFDIPKTAVGPVFVLYFINIHHFFTDGVIWKISNPEVRKDLFAHVPRPVSAPAGALGTAATKAAEPATAT